jgi:hypothetical protein
LAACFTNERMLFDPMFVLVILMQLDETAIVSASTTKPDFKLNFHY